VSFSGAPQTGGSSATWTVGFTTSASGALAAGDKIIVTFNSSFPKLTSTVTLVSGFSHCSRTVGLAAKTLTVTLSDSGGTCALAGSSAATLTVAGLTNPAAGSYAANTFSVKTTKDTAAVNPGSAVVIN
jgi:hypothetical protein